MRRRFAWLIVIVGVNAMVPGTGAAKTIHCPERVPAAPPPGAKLPVNPTVWVFGWHPSEELWAEVAGAPIPIRVEAHGTVAQVRMTASGGEADVLALHIGDQVIKYALGGEAPKQPAGTVTLALDSTARTEKGHVTGVGLRSSVTADVYRIEYHWAPPDGSPPRRSGAEVVFMRPSVSDGIDTLWAAAARGACPSDDAIDTVPGSILYVWATALYSSGAATSPSPAPIAIGSFRGEPTARRRGTASSCASSRWLYAGAGAGSAGLLILAALLITRQLRRSRRR